jgi:Txe/YoeB family toxin of Txe-Axe toxin-antitoxin module
MTASAKYRVRFTRQAGKDISKLSPKLCAKLKDIVRHRLAVDTYSGKPLVGPIKGYYSVRLSYQDGIVYSEILRRKSSEPTSVRDTDDIKRCNSLISRPSIAS